MEIIFKNTYSNIKFVAEFGVISYPLNMQDEGALIDNNVGLINVVGNGVSLTQTDPHKVQLRVDHPLEPVQSVFGRTGNILAEYADYEADQIYKFDEKVENNVEVAQNTSLRHQRIHEWDGNDHSNMPTSFPPSPHTHAHADTTGQTPDDHHAQVHAHDGIDGSGDVAHNSLINRNALNAHDIASITDLQNELDGKAPVGDSFLKTEHIDVSVGINDQGKPIILNSQGQIDPSMIDASTFYYVGPWNPSGGTEYPDTSGESHGAFWVAQDIATPPYTFTGGDLAGLDIDNGDFMVWGTGGWSIMRGEMNPLLYYKLDGSQALTGDFAGGGFAIKNVANGTDTTDGAALGQVIRRDTTGTQDVISSLRVGDGTNYCSMAVQAGGGGNAAYFMLREDGQNAGVIFYDTVYKVLRFIKYSEDDPTQIIGQAYLDEHGDFITSNDLFSGDNITAAGSINVGVNQNANSAVRFTDDASGVPVIFWNNAAKEFQVDVNSDEGFTLYHSGNFSAGRVFEELSSQHWVVGTDTTITLPVYDIAIESVFVDGLLLNPNTAYTMNDTGTEIQVILNVAPTVETCVNYRVRN